MRQLIQAGSNRKGNSRTDGQITNVLSLVQSQSDLLFLKNLAESGKIMPVIDRIFPLSKIVDAIWYFEKEHPRGKVAIHMV